MFSAARVSTLPGANNQVSYQVILVDTVKGFDDTKTTYSVKSAGIYFIHMSAGVPAYQKLSYSLRNASSSPNILLNHTSFDGEIVTSREDIQFLPTSEKLHTSSSHTLYSDTMLQTSWSGFKIDDVMNMKVIFRVARTTSYAVMDTYLPFDQLLINVGQAWDSCNNQLVIPTSGIYFLSFSSASVENTIHRVLLFINEENTFRTFILNTFSGTDVSSNSVILKLNASDIVKLYLTQGPIYSDINYQTSFLGFLYEPTAGQAIAWTLSFPYNLHSYLYGPTNVNFTEVLLNEGSAWDSIGGFVRVPTSGLYYLKLSGTSWPVEYQFNLILSVNGNILMNVMEKINVIRTSVNLRSRSIITHLKEGDQLVVFVPAGYNAYSVKYDVTFVGFIVQPDATTQVKQRFTGK